MTGFAGASAIVTGGTDGIGAATALELSRLGAHVTIVGRSAEKAEAVKKRSIDRLDAGRILPLVADFSEMRNVVIAAEQLAARMTRADLILNAVGILISRTEHTGEGIEKDFAVGYLSRFVLLEQLSAAGLLHGESRLITIAASSRTVPRFARLEFDDLDAVRARVGMRSHGQAQLANDLLAAQAGHRYGITSIGYGPGAVDTSIRREIPSLVRTLIRPFFARSTRQPDEVARQLTGIFSDPSLQSGRSYFYDRAGPFPASDFVADEGRQASLLATSLALEELALGAY